MAARASAKSQEVVQSLRSIITHVMGDASGAWMDLDVTMPQMKVLMLLRENGALRVGILARHLNVSTPTITGIVDRLVRQDLVKREDDPSDRRVVLNVLTPKGEQLMDRLRHRSDEELTHNINALTSQEQADLARLLKRLEETIAASPASAAAD
jgi:DNA-binding MarR family transcriptional regulator